MEAAALQSRQFRKQIQLPEEESAAMNFVGSKGASWRCGLLSHRQDTCPYKKLECFACKEEVHKASMCTKKQKPRRFEQRTKSSQETSRKGPKKKGPSKDCNYNEEQSTEESADETEEEDLHSCNLHAVSKNGPKKKPICTVVRVHNQEIEMEVDTGCAVTLISEKTWRQLHRPALQRTKKRLKTYTGEPVEILGKFEAETLVEGKSHLLPFLVVEGTGPSLLGRNWLRTVRLNWDRLLHISRAATTSTDQYLKPFKDLFKEGLGKMQVPKVHLDLKPDAPPKFHRARPIPYALREAVRNELLKMEEQGILRRVQHSEWAAPLEVVPKTNGAVRICGDYKVTINPFLLVNQYPLPVPEELFATLEGGVLFTKLDLSQAYNQLELDEESTKLCTVNTPIGLFQHTRMPFGTASAPAIFQRVMDDLFRDLP